MEIVREVDEELLKKADEMLALMYTPEFLHANDSRRPHAEQVKIREGVYVIQNMLKTPGGLLHVTPVKENEMLQDVHISADSESVQAAVEKFYAARQIETPGVQPADIARAMFPVAA